MIWFVLEIYKVWIFMFLFGGELWGGLVVQLGFWLVFVFSSRHKFNLCLLNQFGVVMEMKKFAYVFFPILFVELYFVVEVSFILSVREFLGLIIWQCCISGIVTARFWADYQGLSGGASDLGAAYLFCTPIEKVRA